MRALSTGHAARYCFVTSDTIVNWIRDKQLPARRTAGGQYRILTEDLKAFMLRNRMSTELLDAELCTRMYCWEHHACKRAGPNTGQNCRDCPVHRAEALNCYEVRSVLPEGAFCRQDCSECEYYREWGREAAVSLGK